MRLASAQVDTVRRRGAVLISLLVAFTQVSPALACAAFDGPGGPGCPIMFRGTTVYVLDSPAKGETDRQPEPGGTREDCSTGPAYLVPDLDPPRVSVPIADYPSAHPQEPLSGDDGLALAVRILPSDSLRQATASGGRHTYLTTLRLRI